jgi:YHS domain-containing protein
MTTRIVRLVTPLSLAFVLALIAAAGLQAQKTNTDSAKLALKGYDPVAYFTDGDAVKGDAQFEVEHLGVTYRFASAAHRDLFANAPDNYLPQYGGFCAWAVSRGYTADTDPLAWKVVNDKLYLNYSKSVQGKWQADVPGNIAKGDANWPGLSRK